MDESTAARLAHVLWIGGGTDAGKTTVADLVGERLGAEVYHYDRTDVAHHQRLAERDPMYREFMNATMEQRWLEPTPQEMAERARQSFRDRMPFVMEELRALAPRWVVAEGFGFTPEFVAPLLVNTSQAIWLIPSQQFKQESMQRRDKPSFRHKLSDPDRVLSNLLERDSILTQHVLREAEGLGLRVLTVDGSRTPQEIGEEVEAQFRGYLEAAGYPFPTGENGKQSFQKLLGTIL